MELKYGEDREMRGPPSVSFGIIIWEGKEGEKGKEGFSSRKSQLKNIIQLNINKTNLIIEWEVIVY